MSSIRKQNSIMAKTQNRNPVKQWFITFPKSSIANVTKASFAQTLNEHEIKFAHIVQEDHKDDTQHLHAVIQFSTGITKSKLLKWFKDTYPKDNKRIHVCPVRSLKKSLEYCGKEDTNPVVLGHYSDPRNTPTNIYNKKLHAKIKQLKKWSKNIPELGITINANYFKKLLAELEYQDMIHDYQLPDYISRYQWLQDLLEFYETKYL